MNLEDLSNQIDTFNSEMRRQVKYALEQTMQEYFNKNMHVQEVTLVWVQEDERDRDDYIYVKDIQTLLSSPAEEDEKDILQEDLYQYGEALAYLHFGTYKFKNGYHVQI